MVPRVAVANAQIELIQLRIIYNRVPHRPAAAAFTPVTLFGLAAPRTGCCRFQDVVARGIVGLARRVWRRVETPSLRASGCIIRRDVAPCAKFRAAEAYNDLVLHDARYARDRAVGFEIKRLDAPILLSGAGIK